MDARRWDRLSLGVTNGLKAWLWYGVAEYVLHTAGPLLFQVQRGGAPGGRTRVSSFGILPLSPRLWSSLGGSPAGCGVICR